MPNFTVDQMRTIMDKTDNIRSMSVIAHVDHGKSTLTDSLICKAGIISAKAAGDARFTDTRADEQERGVTIKSTGVSLYFEHEDDDSQGPKPHLINLTPGPKIDSPGHVDFSSEVTAALRITDGAMVVVDCIEGCAVQTETVLRQALQERVRPCLFVNKVDRCILELQMEAEDMYSRFRQAIENVNVIIATYNDALMGDVQVTPEKGTVAFGSGLHGWGFTTERFAKIYATKMGVEKARHRRCMWGDSFFNAKKKVWTNVMQPEGCTEPLQRAFCQFIMGPINQLMRAIMNDDKEKYEKMMGTLGIVLKGDEKSLTGKPLMKRTMQIWINAADTLLGMIVTKLPSPPAGPEVPRGELVRGSHGRCGGQRHPQLRSCRATDDVRLEDGAHLRQGPLLRLRPGLLRHHRHGAEGANPGALLQAWDQGGPARKEHPADRLDDGPHHRADPGCALRQHRGPGWRGPVHPEVRNHHQPGGRTQHRGHEVQRESGGEGGCEGQGRQGPAQAGGGPEETLQVGPAGGLHHRGERRARHRRLRGAPRGDLLEGAAQRGGSGGRPGFEGRVRPVRLHRLGPRGVLPRDRERAERADLPGEVPQQAQPHLPGGGAHGRGAEQGHRGGNRGAQDGPQGARQDPDREVRLG
ncbi:unnamed protein product [Effrenium voratum]|nr:unnamed protein product [Effrenium voratum]